MSESESKPAEHLDDASWQTLTSAVASFEAEWSASGSAAPEAFVPPPGDSLRPQILVELLKVDQEFRLSRGELRTTEDYLEDWPELLQEPAARRDLLFAECLTRAIQGDLPDHQDLRNRFPDLVDDLDLAAIAAEYRQECDRTMSRETETFRRAEHDTVQVDRSAPPVAPEGHSVQPELPDSQDATGSASLGRYRLLEEMGRGAAAVVYRALDTQLKREVAIKVPRPELLESADSRERLLREAQAAASLRHAAVVPIHEVGEDNGRVFVVFELIEGPTLADRVKDDPPSVDQAALWVMRIAEALDYAHRNNIVHRDVKPANILIDKDGRAVLTDFGLARQQEAGATLTRDGDLLGTPAYMSPEQARGEGHHADARSDIYSLGVVLYELLTGRRPFDGSVASVLSRVVHEQPEPPRSVQPDIPIDLETVCLKAMAKEPSQRYQTASQCADDLRRYLNGFPVHAKPTGVAHQFRSWLTERPGSAVVVFVSLIVAVAAIKMRSPPLETDDAVPPPAIAAPASADSADSEARTTIANAIGMTFTYIAPGEFLMGGTTSPEECGRLFNYDAKHFRDEYPRHRVQITKPFYLGTTEVTQRQWELVMRTRPWTGTGNVNQGDRYPATVVTWEQAVDFCERLTQQEGVSYRLPTEAEWEYASRAGSDAMFCFGDDLSALGAYAWWRGNATEAGEAFAHQVGLKKSNRWGLYDMHGNVYEWCSDWYSPDYYSESPTVDPAGPASGPGHVYRSGNWGGPERYSRSAYRYFFDARYFSSDKPANEVIGFRVVRSVDEAQEPGDSE